jgi:hypothetical protein
MVAGALFSYLGWLIAHSNSLYLRYYVAELVIGAILMCIGAALFVSGLSMFAIDISKLESGAVLGRMAVVEGGRIVLPLPITA